MAALIVTVTHVNGGHLKAVQVPPGVVVRFLADDGSELAPGDDGDLYCEEGITWIDVPPCGESALEEGER